MQEYTPQSIVELIFNSSSVIEDRIDLERAVDMLPELRKAFVVKLQEGYTYEEAARAIGATQGKRLFSSIVNQLLHFLNGGV